ncbi:TetR family transcriptional regulator [Heyndrickxia oleronia]|uniref:TetR/AcrR family transcriptional regulator n=1 Tax=Heyndrickxia oleronia TaxID=38875 RepID=UPI0009031782|nr:TetR family transcriptional regulator [Heyndrickxia oleronia]MCM3454010.1 TetR family transcriptional regulator [Heyndrickxia oleronia]OJH18474.1 TetR family transcriptional regulator [Bacillus obstructivus]
MPKLTFFNLPEIKKQTLIHAAKQEFSRVPLFDASIANIVKAAGIPRGSFYQYFEDKEDAFFYLLNEHSKSKKQQFIFFLNKYDGDIFNTMAEFYQLMIKDAEDLNFLKNAFLNMTHKIERSFEKMVSDNESSGNFKEISSIIDKEQLNITNDGELVHVLQIIMAVTLRNIVDNFAKDLPYEVAVKNYMIEINLLKKGLSK